MLKEESLAPAASAIKAPAVKAPAIKVGGRGRHASFSLDENAPISELEHQIRRYLDDSGGFFLGAQVSVDLGRRMANPEEVERIRRVLEQEYFLEVSQWRTTCDRMEAGLSAYMGASTVIQPPETAPDRERTLVVRGACHSGSSTQHEGDILVLGDVNPGAQVEASGDVIVFGALRGVAAAGSRGDESAVIAALSLRATQIRIARKVAVGLERKKSRRSLEPEMASIRDGQIVVEPFDAQVWRFRAMEGK